MLFWYSLISSYLLSHFSVSVLKLYSFICEQVSSLAFSKHVYILFYSMVQKSRFELKTQQSKCCVIPFHHFWICIASPHRSSFNIRIFLQIKNRKEVPNISIFFLGGVYKKIYAAIFKGFIARWRRQHRFELWLTSLELVVLPLHYWPIYFTYKTTKLWWKQKRL